MKTGDLGSEGAAFGSGQVPEERHRYRIPVLEEMAPPPSKDTPLSVCFFFVDAEAV